jgi:hypothetical protein
MGGGLTISKICGSISEGASPLYSSKSFRPEGVRRNPMDDLNHGQVFERATWAPGADGGVVDIVASFGCRAPSTVMIQAEDVSCRFGV